MRDTTETAPDGHWTVAHAEGMLSSLLNLRWIAGNEREYLDAAVYYSGGKAAAGAAERFDALTSSLLAQMSSGSSRASSELLSQTIAELDEEGARLPDEHAKRSAALADVVLRSAGDVGERIVRRTTVARRRASVVATVEDLALVDLRTGPALAAVAQDRWLVAADCGDYPMTRRWGSWIRSKALWAKGFIWATRGSANQGSVVLFGDRRDASVFAKDPHFTINLDSEVGTVSLNSQLVSVGAQIEG